MPENEEYNGQLQKIINIFMPNFAHCHRAKVALLDRVTQTVQTRLISDRDYNTTIGSIRG